MERRKQHPQSTNGNRVRSERKCSNQIGTEVRDGVTSAPAFQLYCGVRDVCFRGDELEEELNKLETKHEGTFGSGY